MPDAPNDQVSNRAGENDLPQLGERANSAHARWTAGRLKIQEEHTHDFAKSQRQDHHVDAANTQRRGGGHQARHGGGTATGDERDEERHIGLCQHGADVSADRHEPALPQRNETRCHRDV